MILILNDRKCQTAGSNLTNSLKKAFRETTIISADAPQFIKALEHHNPAAIVLPEISGEVNYYPKYLGSYGKTLIKTHVKKGAMYAGFCCGAWNALSINRYEPPHGPHLFKSDADLLELTVIHGLGPATGYATKMNEDNHQEGGKSCKQIPVIIQTKEGIISTEAYYENGPIFHIGNGDVPKDTKVIARYKLENKRPAAVLTTQYGEGSVLLSGVLPHLKKENFDPDHPLWNAIKEEFHQHLLAFKAKHMIPRSAWKI